jgi:hypothetical protein
MNQRPRDLLRLAFHLSGGGDAFWSQVDPIKNTFLGFQPRADRMRVARDASRPTGNANAIEFVAFTKSTEANAMFIRDTYFNRPQRDRALTLIHEYVHLRNPLNSGDGHPGGVVILFEEGDVGVDYPNAIRNPYCYQ